MPMVINVQRKKHFPEVLRFTKKLHKKSSRVWRDAAGAYTLAVAYEVARHQDTGMSLGSLFPMARDFRVLGKMPAISPKHRFSRGVTTMDGSYNSGRMKSASAGKHAGEIIANKLARIMYGSPSRVVFRFEFNIVVYQYMLHEFGFQTPAWNSTIRGSAAFNEYLRQYGYQAFPALVEWWVKREGIK